MKLRPPEQCGLAPQREALAHTPWLSLAALGRLAGGIAAMRPRAAFQAALPASRGAASLHQPGQLRRRERHTGLHGHERAAARVLLAAAAGGRAAPHRAVTRQLQLGVARVASYLPWWSDGLMVVRSQYPARQRENLARQEETTHGPQDSTLRLDTRSPGCP